MSALGNYVRKKREALQAKHTGYSIRQVAKRIGLHHSYLSKLERGENAPLSAERLAALARELSEEPEVLIALSGRLPDHAVRLISENPQRFLACLADFSRDARGGARCENPLVGRLAQRNRELEELARRLRDEMEARRAAQSLLARKESEQRLILNNLRDVVVEFIDRDYNLLWASENVARYLSCPLSEALGRKCHEVVRQRLSPCEDCTAAKAISTGQVQDGSHQTPDGRSWRVRSVPILDGAGRTVKVVHFGFDVSELIRTREHLQESEQRWKFALEGAQEGVWDWDAQSNKVYFSNQWKLMLGYADDEIGDDLSEWDNRVHPDDREAVWEVLQRHLAGETDHYEAEHRIKCKDGRYKCILDRGKVMSRDAEGRPLRVIGTHFDITDRKAAEQALLEREANFRGFYETMTDMVWVVGLDGRILLANNAVCRILGYSFDELRSMHLLDMHPMELRQEAVDIFEGMLRGELAKCPLPLLRRDGRPMPVETRIWRGRWHSQDCVFGISRDLSVEMESRERFESLFRNNPAPMALTVLPERRFVDVNDVFLATLGYDKVDVVGRTAQELGLFLDAETWEQTVTALLSDGRVRNMEMCVQCKDGSFRYGVFSAELVRGQRADHVVSVMLDITERKQAEQYHEEVERILRHDLKTPLAGLIGLPQLLREDTNLTQEQRSLLDTVSASGQRMLSQINATLELHKIEDGIYRFPGRECDPTLLVQQNVEMLGSAFGAGPERFQIRAGATEGRLLRTDPLLLDIVLANLLRNALEGSDPGSPVRIGLVAEGEGYAIAITNNRPVPAEVRDRFFEKFVTAGKPGGTGLGTYSAALMVRAMGGEITMETSDAEGTTVTVRFPLGGDANPTGEPH